MALNAILEIIISLVALFWLLSTACSFVVEAFNSLLLNIRAKALERFVCEMVLGSNRVPQLRDFLSFWRRSNLERTRDPDKPETGSLADPLGLFSHGLVLALRKPQNIPGGKASPPSYIPAPIFAQSLLDRLMSLSWGLLADSQGTIAVLNAIPLPPHHRTALDKAVAGPAERAPLLFAVVELLKGLHDKPVSEATRAIEVLIQELTKAKRHPAVIALDKTPLIPAIPSLDSSPVGLVQLLIDVLERANEALQAVARRAQRIRFKPWKKEPKLGDLISTESLWMLAVRKAGRDILHSPALMQTMRSLIDTAPLPVALREALRPLVAQANFDGDVLRKAIEGWFDSVMERATGWFKRYTTLWLGLIGFAAAVFLNVNTIRIAQDLAKDPELRHAGVAFAEFVVREQGRPELAQQYRFHEFAEAQRWDARVRELKLKDLPLCHRQSCELLDLAQQTAPLLLRDGHVQGLMWSLPLDSRAGTGNPAWAHQRSDFLNSLCRAMQLRSGVAVDTKSTASQAFKPRAEAEDCKWIKDEFKDDGTWESDLLAFWNSGRVVWAHGDIALGSAFRKLIVLATGPASAEPTEEHLAALKTSLEDFQKTFKATLSRSAEVHASARSYLDRIPSLGRNEGWPVRRAEDAPLGFTWNWNVDRVFPGGVVLDLLGWVITAVMVSFGASFWFDLLSNLVDRRATGPRPESKA